MPTHHRWLRLGGPVGVQPSELAKPALVVFLAFFVTWRGARHQQSALHAGSGGAGGGAGDLFAVVVADLGTAVVLGLAAATVFLRGRACNGATARSWRGSRCWALVVFICREPYRLARVVRFFDPQFKIIDPLRSATARIKARMEKSLATRDTNYQSEQSKIAVGAGGPLGVGLMNGRQKLLYLPEAHTDFIYAVVGEELGLVGSVGVLLAFVRDFLARACAPPG